MYYIGEILHGDLNIYGQPIIELWDGVRYTKKEAKVKIDEINKENDNKYLHLEIIDEDKSDIDSQYGWDE